MGTRRFTEHAGDHLLPRCALLWQRQHYSSPGCQATGALTPNCAVSSEVEDISSSLSAGESAKLPRPTGVGSATSPQVQQPDEHSYAHGNDDHRTDDRLGMRVGRHTSAARRNHYLEQTPSRSATLPRHSSQLTARVARRRTCATVPPSIGGPLLRIGIHASRRNEAISARCGQRLASQVSRLAGQSLIRGEP